MQADDPAAGILCVVSRGAHADSLGEDCLDAVMTAVLLNQPVALFFVGDGVFQLTTLERAEKILSLREFGSLDLFARKLDLEQRGLDATVIPDATGILDTDSAKALFIRHDQILSF
ncbi:DsrE family protein [Gilvimarinus sp. F26214L]|uniref:DsrE family protein n=1 Tax=Gilvimarinus sp. DZF01 TaxID=3461371 RepID=UPI0040465E6E